MSALVRLLPIWLGLLLSGCGNFKLMGSSAYADAEPSFIVGPVLQNATSVSVGVMWETAAGEESTVDYGTTPAMGETQSGEMTPSVKGTSIHHVTLTGLAPDTKYYYKARTGGTESRIFQLTTPPLEGDAKPFRFAVYSDCQQRPGVHRRIVDQGIYGTMPAETGTPDDALGFVLVAGDVVQDGREYDEYKQRLFDPTRNVSPYVPYYTAIGNHERNHKSYFDYLNLPANGSPGYEEHWYSFRYGNAHVIGLDTNAEFQVSKQLEWLDQDLAKACGDPTVAMIFAFFHHPWRSELWLPGEEAYSGEIVRRVESTIRRCDKVGAYFFGHTHGYSRGQSKDANLYHVNVGSAGGTIDNWGGFPQKDYEEYQKTFDEYGVLIVDVNPAGKVGFSARRLTFGDELVSRSGEVQDDFHVYAGEVAPKAPEITSVTMQMDPAALAARTTASAFADADGGTHLEAEWQLATRIDGFDQPVDGKWLRVENIFMDRDTMAGLDIKSVDWALPDAAQRFARVRYRDDGLAWSPWSTPVPLQTRFSSR